MATNNSVNVGLAGATGTVNFVGSTSPTLVTPILGAASATSLSFSTTSGIIGTTTNDNAAAGSVGEFISSTIASGSAVSLVTQTAKTITSISLTAGDWDMWCNIIFVPNAATTIAALALGINTVTDTLPDFTTGAESITFWNHPFDLGGSQAFGTAPIRVSISGATNYYMVGYANFGVNTMAAYGSIYARRMR